MKTKNERKTSKKLVTTFLATVTLMAATVAPALAAPKVRIVDDVGYGGSGCPDRSASVTVSPDGQELTILFDEFIADAAKRKHRRKSCNLSIPIEVPQGFQISLYDADYRGYVAPLTTARLRAEYFFAGQRGPIFSRTFKGETEYFVRDPLESVANIWSRCGDSLNMRVNAAMTARGKGMATVDSFDLAHRGLKYHIKYRSCNK